MPDTWFPKATRRDGPPVKTGYFGIPSRPLDQIKGLVGHSMEGPLSAAIGELENLNRQASWPFSNPKVGPLIEHYSLEKICWTNGSVQSNVMFVGVEHEGVAGELINLNQRQNLADLLLWLNQTCPNIKGWERGRSLFEHREMTAYGSAATACPSNRIPWAQVLGLIKQEVDMILVKTPNGSCYVIGAYGKRWIDDVEELGVYAKRLPLDEYPQEIIDKIPDFALAGYSFLAELGLEKKP